MIPIDDVINELGTDALALLPDFPSLPSRPGIYAIHADGRALEELKVDRWTSVGRPVYVGKSETSLGQRDIGTHFSDGKTGSSTLRRSLAALLSSQLGLSGQPRNHRRPGHFSNFGLSPEHDLRLTNWMREHLSIATWVGDARAPLGDVEASVLANWNPVLNLTKVTHQNVDRLRAERAVLAEQARRWTPSTG